LRIGLQTEEETIMANKVQGEGDYESARRYNEETAKFVKDKAKSGESIRGSAAEASEELTPEEQTALKHAKGAAQDRRDADLLRKLEKEKPPK
jgi:hypothetical protein